MTTFEFDVFPSVAEVDVETPIVDASIVENQAIGMVIAPGKPGPTGPPGTGFLVVGEIPGGDLDGVNTIFTTENVFKPGSISLYLNGLREYYFAETGLSEITIEDPPGALDMIRIDYVVQ